MPCNSDYLAPTKREVEISRIHQLLDELDGKVIDQDAWDGFDPRVYNQFQSKDQQDCLVETLCQKIKQLKDINHHSLEMQMWWRDHQLADQKRQSEEKELKQRIAIRETAWNKLSPEERQVLDLD